MRALLVVNPQATATTSRVRDILVHALGRASNVDAVETRSRGHAIALATQARADDVDLVVALGGDGTVNEVVNGLLADSPGPAAHPVPTFAVVPGGSANVFVRALGFSRDPIEATAQLIDGVRLDRTRRVGLGRVADRWFAFNAGFGFDAEVIERVERYRSEGRDASPALYVQATLTQFARAAERHSPTVQLLDGPAGAVSGLYFGIVANASPWTYLGPRPVNLLPLASFETGLDLLAPRSMRTSTLVRAAARAAIDQRPRVKPHQSLLQLHDLARFTLASAVALPLQVDGDSLGRHREVVFTAEPDALTVIAGPSTGAGRRRSGRRQSRKLRQRDGTARDWALQPGRN